MSIRKILDQLSEMATTSGSVATVASPMGGTQKRSKDSIFYEGDAVCHTCHQHKCQCDANSRRAPESPEVANFGLWKNSILAGKEQKAKKKSKVKESATDYNPPSQGGTRKELLDKLKTAKTAAERSDLSTRARKAGASQDELKSASVDESTVESWSIRFMDGGKEDKMTVKAASNKEALKKWRAKKPDAEIIGISRAKQVDESDDSFVVSTLRSAWNRIERVDPDSPHYNKLIQLLNSLSQETLQELVDAKIKFVSNLARNRIKKSVDEGSDERLADLSKISTAKLQELVSLHRHAGGNNPLAAKAAKRGAEELLKRGVRVPMDESKDYDHLASDETQGNLKKMADRHGKEQWTLDQLKALGKKLASVDKKTQRVDELGRSRMPGAQRPLKLAEQDFILNPHDVRRVSRDVVSKIDPRQDREIEMACSDLFQAAKNAREIMQMVKGIPETVGLEGWVQEKIIKAADYLNTVREYLEGQQAKSMMSGKNVSLGNMLDESVDNPLEAALVRRFMSQHTDVLQQYGPKNVLAAIEDVASEFDAGDELGTSDVSAYARRVLSYLDNNFDNQVDENVAAALMAAGAAGVGGILANKIIAMIDDARDRVKDMKEKRNLEAELNKVEKYLDSSPAMAESKIVKTRK